MESLKESVEIRRVSPAEVESEIALLHEPWVCQEGPLDAAVRRGLDGEPLQRGLAFDDRTTVVWDEDEVQIVTAAPAEPSVTALPNRVLIRERWSEPQRLNRIDYLRDGALIASRYTEDGEEDA